MEFFPSSISTAASYVLIVLSFVTSFITAAMGIGGGMVLLAAMASVMPAAAIVPIHGVVQLGSNVGRAGLQRAHIDWRTFAIFAAGTVIGVAIGGSIVVTLEPNVLRAGLAVFILYMLWGPQLRFVGESQWFVAAMGVGASILTMFFGATGAFVTSLLRQRGYTPRELVATHSVCMSAQHTLKLIAFGILGFAFAEWLGLVALMLVSGFAGTWCGSQVLNRLPAKAFGAGLKAILTVLALNLLAMAAGLYSIG